MILFSRFAVKKELINTKTTLSTGVFWVEKTSQKENPFVCGGDQDLPERASMIL